MAGPSGAKAAGAAPKKGLTLRNVRLRAVGFEAPAGRDMSLEKIDWDNVDVRTQREVVGRKESLRELMLGLYVHATSGDGTVFRGTVEEIGVFDVQGYTDEEANEMLRTKGAEQLYPYARELMLSLIARSGMALFTLSPMNLELPD